MKKSVLNTVLITSLLISLSFTNSLLGQVQYSGTVNTGTTSSAINYQTQSLGAYSFATGYQSIANGSTSTAIGYKATAYGTRSVSIGESSYSADQGYSFGQGAKANISQSLAIGRFVETNASGAIAIGSSISGYSMINSIPNSLMIGFNSTVPTFFISPSQNYIGIGKVGIGSINPRTTLDVSGDMTVSSLANNSTFDYITSTDATGKFVLIKKSSLADNLGNHSAIQDLLMNGYNINSVGSIYGNFKSSGSGTVENYGKLEIFGSQLENASKIEIGDGENSQEVKFITRTKNSAVQFYVGGNWSMQVKNSEVLVGNPYQQDQPVDLKVYGKIFGREVKVTLDTYYDHVFSPEYKLMPLDELSDFVRHNRHLPDIPTEQLVLQEGLNIGEMSSLLLKKVEELTLYVIELEKKCQSLEEKISSSSLNK